MKFLLQRKLKLQVDIENRLEINLEKNYRDYESDEIAAIISTINSDPANTLFSDNLHHIIRRYIYRFWRWRLGWHRRSIFGKITDQMAVQTFLPI